VQKQNVKLSGRAGTVLIVGDAGSGKSSLWKAILKSQLNGQVPRIVASSPLLYGYLDFEGIDDRYAEAIDAPQINRIDLWTLQQLGGDDGGQDIPDGKFLSCVLNASSVEETVIMLCVDLSNPPDLARSVCEWIKLLQSHIVDVTTPEQVLPVSAI
jgi:GTPase SAR1 family protein